MDNYLRALGSMAPLEGGGLGRRDLLKGAAGLGALAPFMTGAARAEACSSSGTLTPSSTFGWDDAATNLAMLSRMWGTIEPGEEAYLYVFGPAFGMRKPGSFYPLFRLESLANVRTFPQKNGGFRYLANQVILFCDFWTNEILDVWDNPYTGETVEVFHYRDGPLDYKLDPNAFPERYAMETKDPALKRKLVLDWFFRGDLAYGDAIARTSLPNKLDPEEWPRASVGARWDTFEVYRWAAKMRELEDLDLPSVPSFQGDFQTFKPWEPWMLMGQTPGQIFSVRTAYKPKSLDEVPCHVTDWIAKNLPDYLHAPKDFHGQYLLNDHHYRDARQPSEEPLPPLRDL